MRSIAWLAVATAVLPASAAATGLYSPTVIHRTSPGPAVVTPARPATAPGGVTSITPSVVLGWGGLAPSTGQPPGYTGPAAALGYPAAPPYYYPNHSGYPPYPAYPAYPVYPGYAVPPGMAVPPGIAVPPAAPDTVHRWGTR